jgi:hypothetical protein
VRRPDASTKEPMMVLPAMPTTFHVYDTTLRDGAQQEGLNLSVRTS